MTRAREKREEQMSVRERLLNSAATCAQFPQENEKESLSLALTRRLNAADTFSLSDREMHPLSARFRNKPTLIKYTRTLCLLEIEFGNCERHAPLVAFCVTRLLANDAYKIYIAYYCDTAIALACTLCRYNAAVKCKRLISDMSIYRQLRFKVDNLH